MRQPIKSDVRVSILGQLEARLLTMDRLVLGGLNEGTWPPETRSDPWLSRPMRQELGLDLPERRIGLSAHDFAQALGARRSSSRAPPKSAVCRPSRRASCSGSRRSPGTSMERARARRTISCMARALDRPAESTPTGARARAAARGAADAAQRHRDRGLAARSLHDLRQAHAKLLRSIRSTRRPARRSRHRRSTARSANSPRLRDALPADPSTSCCALGEKHFAPLAGFPRGARILVAALCAHRAMVRRAGRASGAPHATAIHAEISGELDIPLGKRELQASRPRRPHRAARRRQLRDPRLQDRRAADREAGAHRAFAAADARRRDPARRRFQGIPAGHRWPNSSMSRCRAASRAGERQPIEFKDGDAGQQADHALARLKGVIATRSTSRRRPIVRWCIRCGRRATATTTISRACKEWSLPAATDEDER